MRLLLVEDDPMIGDGLEIALKQSGYILDWVQDGESALNCLKTESYQAIILDVGLPKYSGWDILKQLRSWKIQSPVLMLTAKDGLEDRLKGLDGGADDYMIKPFFLEELEARLRLLLRRHQNRTENILRVGTITLNPQSFEVTQNGSPISLSAKEFALLRSFMESPTTILSKGQLESRLYGWNEEVCSNAIEVHIHQLRKKLGKNSIKTIRGIGYQIQQQDLC